MSKTKKDPYQAARERQERARERQRKKMNDPAEIEKRRQNAIAAAQRQRDKRAAKEADPEYRAQQLQKKIDAANRQKEKKLTAKPAAKKTPTKKVVKIAKPIKSKGLVGRSPTAEEKRVMDLLGSLPCIACMLKGRHRPLISLHHLDGRVVEFAHMRTLPLCAEHHDTPASPEVIANYPDLVPYHARGKWGGKAAWRKENGCEYEMLALAFRLIDYEPPFEVPEIDTDVMPLLSFCA